MPELPEVEVLVRHLAPALRNRRIESVTVRRVKVTAPLSARQLERQLVGATFRDVTRRGKYLLFHLASARAQKSLLLLGHLGMTGRMYLQPADATWPKHAAAVLDLGDRVLIYEDPRYFGRLTLDASAIASLGPEPLDAAFAAEELAVRLRRSQQPVKVKLMDQTCVAGIGNIYASEALFRAGISPMARAHRLSGKQIAALWKSIRQVLREAIRFGSTVPLDWSGRAGKDALFFYGSPEGAADYYEERLQVYDREGEECLRCRGVIRRIQQVNRSTYYCPRCQIDR